MLKWSEQRSQRLSDTLKKQTSRDIADYDMMLMDPPANFLYKMVGHVPHIKPFFYREFLVFFWMLEPVLYHFTFLDLGTSIL